MKGLQKRWGKVVFLELEHQPVLVKEVLEFLAVREGGIYLDCTVGAGGHAREILRQVGLTGRLVGLDKDRKALNWAREVLTPYADQVVLVHRDFCEVKKVLNELEITQVDGILFDLGVSSLQILTPDRGFSYIYDAPLDMRMDQEAKTTAYDLVNNLEEKDLAEIIFRYGEEKWAKRIASFIVARRKKRSITTTGQLVDVIKAAIPAAARRKGPHPAKRTFQALRIAVNGELMSLTRALQDAVLFLKPGARIIVISFHSLEDRIVKSIFRELASPCFCGARESKCTCGRGILRILTRKPVTPTTQEVRLNSRARSAKLRAAERLVPLQV